MGFFKSSDDATVEEPRARKPSRTRKVHQSKENVNKDMYETIPDHPLPYRKSTPLASQTSNRTKSQQSLPLASPPISTSQAVAAADPAS